MTTAKTPEEEGLVKEPEVKDPEVNDQDVDVFSEAFDVAEKTATPDLSDADDPAKQKEPEPEPKKDAEDEPVKEPEKEPEKTVVKDPPAEPVKPEQKDGESDEAYKQRWLTLQGIHKSDKEKWESREKELLAEVEAAKKPAEPAPVDKKEAEPFDLRKILDGILTDEQKAELKDYEAEFDMVSKMEGLKRDVAFTKLREEFDSWKKSFADELRSQLKPTETFVAETKEAREEADKIFHFDSIRTAHPDFETYRDDGTVLKWIESKPAYLQVGMKEAYEHGAAADVISLLADFKKENNITTPSAEAVPDNVVEIDKKKQEIEAEKAKKKKAMESPISRRGAVNPSHGIADDFESAFDEALQK